MSETKLELQRPLAFFDLETTGLSITQDRIVEIAIVKVNPDGEEEILVQRLNPEMHIPEKVTEIHGIRDEDVADMPTFSEFAPRLKKFLVNCDLAGYNSNYFDVPVLSEEFSRADIDFDFKNCKKIDVQVIFHKNEPRDLKAAYKFYCDKELVNAHEAKSDALATYHILKSQLNKYSDLKGDVAFLERFTSRNHKMVDHANLVVADSKGVELLNFGKFKGKPVTEVLKDQPGFYNWIMKGDFPAYTKKVITEIKLKSFKIG